MKNSRPYIVLIVGLLAVSTAAILIRKAQAEAMPSMLIAAGRLAVASTALSLPALRRHRSELARLSRGEIGLALLSGIFLAAHFATWITSLEFTSVAASVVLVSTSPIFVAVLSFLLLRENVNRRVVLGILLAFVGSIIVAAGDDAGNAPTRADPVLGNVLAVGGAVTIAAYMIIGRRLRSNLSVVPYVWLVYSAAAVTLVVVLMFQGEAFSGYPTAGYIWILVLGLVPQLIGHSSFNYALGHLPAAYVSLVILGEPVGSAILAVILLGELPARVVWAGSVTILAGIGLAAVNQDTG